jgi:hypothetical protein
MPSGVLQRSQRLAIGQDNRPIEALKDTTQLRNRTLDSRKRGGDSFRRPAVAGPRGPIDPVSSCWISSYWMLSAALKRSRIEQLGKPRERPCSSIEEGSD